MIFISKIEKNRSKNFLLLKIIIRNLTFVIIGVINVIIYVFIVQVTKSKNVIFCLILFWMKFFLLIFSLSLIFDCV
jgi:hypothetical protein